MLRLQYKIALLPFLVGCAFVLLGLTAHYQYFTKATHQEAQQSLQLLSHKIALQVDFVLQEKADKIKALTSAPVVENLLLQSNAKYSSLPTQQRNEQIVQLNQQWMDTEDKNSPFIQAFLTNSVAKYFFNQFNINPEEYGEIFLTNRYGALVASTEKLTTFAHGSKYWWTSSYNDGKGKTFFDDRGFDASVKGYVLGIVVPVKKDGQIIGILKSNIRIQKVLDKIVNCSSTEHIQTLIVRDRGAVVLQREHDPLSTKVNPEIQTKLDVLQAGSLPFDDGAIPSFAGFSPVAISHESDQFSFGGNPKSIDQWNGNQGEGWNVVSTDSKAHALQLFEQSSRYFYMVNILVVFVLALIVLYIGRQLSIPLKAFSAAAKLIGAGEFDIKLPVSSQDELGEAAKAFNAMSENLATTMATKEEYSLEIEQRKQTEKALKASEARYRSLIENQTDLVCRLTPDGQFIFVNDIYCQFFSMSKDELIDSKWQPLPVDDDLELINEKLSKLSPKNPTVDIENRVRSGKGEIHWMHFSNSGIFDSQGNLLEIQSVGRDITDRKKSEEAVLKSEARYARAARGTSDGLWDWNVVTNEDYLSPRWKELLGFAEDELTNEYDTFFSKVHPDDVSRVQEAINAHLEQCIPYNIKHRLRTKSGDYKWFHVRGMAERDEQGQPLSMSGSITDMTEFMQAEAEKEKLELELRQKYKMEAVGVMAGGMAHNFNNNLSIILGNLELTKMTLTDHPEAGTFLDNAKTGVLRSRDLISQIMTYSRKEEQHKAPLQLSEVIDEVIAMLKSTIPSSIYLQQKLSPDSIPAYIQTNASQIQEILLNLCNNAVHAMDEQGKLTITLDDVQLKQQQIPAHFSCKPGQYLCLGVQDTGCGMTSETQQKIFDPFFTTKEMHEGTGMGLSTVHGIMEQLQGMIVVESHVGQGTTFKLYFPEVEATIEDDSSLTTADLPKGTECILLVDDDEMIATMTHSILTEMGYQVTLMTDSLEALKLFAANADSFDLLITDQTMPGLTGKELIQEIKQIRSDIFTIICTGYSNKIDEDKAKELGISAFLMKPLDLPELLQTMRRVLDGVKE